MALITSIGAPLLAATAASGAPGAASGPELEAADARVRDVLIELRLPSVLDPELEFEPDPVVRATARIRLARARLTATEDPPRDRAAVIDGLMGAHEDRLSARGEDPRAVGWHLERAEDAWRWLRTVEGAQRRVLAGVPRPIDVERVQRASAAMRTSTLAAGSLIDRLLAALEADPRWPNDSELRREHRRLSDDARDRRLATLEALSLGFAVAIAPAIGPDQPGPAPDQGAGASSAGTGAGALGDHAAAARKALAGLIARLEPAVATARPPGTVDGTGVTIAAARALLARAEAAGGDAAAADITWETARAAATHAGDPVLAAVLRLESIVHAAERGSAADRVAAAASLAESVVAGEEASDLPGAMRPAIALATADAAFRLAAPAGRGGAPGAWEAATRGWVHLADTDAGWRATVLERFRLGLEPDDPPDALPALGALALAELAERSGDGPSDELVRRLESAARDAAVARADRADAAWRAGRAVAGRGDVPAAGRWMTDAATIEPDDRRSHAMLDAALRLVVASAVSDPVPAGEPTVDLLHLLRGRHAAVPGAARWRLSLASRLVRLGQVEAALAALETDRPAVVDPADAAPPIAGESASVRATWHAVQLDALEARLAAAPGGSPDDAGLIAMIEALDAAAAWLAAGPAEVTDPDGLVAPRATGDRAAWRRTTAWLSLGAPVRAWDAAAAGLEARRGRPSGPATPALLAAAGEALDGLADPARRREAAEALAASGSADAFAMLALRLDRAMRRDDADDTRPFDHAGRGIDLSRAVGPLARGAAIGFERSGWSARVATLESVSEAEAPASAARTLASARRLTLALAEFERRLGEHDAARARYDVLGGLDAADPTVLFGAAECRFAAGDEADLAEAMPAYRRLAGNEVATGQHRWWVVQLRMLETLDRVQRNLDHIAPRIERLRVRDPEFGGPRTKAAFERLIRRHARGG